MKIRVCLALASVGWLFVQGCSGPAFEPVSRRAKAAEGMIGASGGRLGPVYAPLAEQIVRDYDLADKDGIGIDLGSGPGTLIVELCKRTKMHWINADINPDYFPYFLEMAEDGGFGGRVSAIRADSQDLPFKDDYADIIVSRGSYHFWKDKVKAFGEIRRVLKPGGVAFIGRGFARDFPVEAAKKVRAGHKMKYDPKQKAEELRGIMKELGIEDYEIFIPETGKAAGINYGCWIEFRK